MASGYAGLLRTEPTDPTLLDLRAALAGTYEIEAPLGRGGMSFVYLARERRLDRRVAIKVLSPELAVDDAYRRLFLHEARTVAALTHPNIVPIHAVGEVGDFVFFAMAYVEGDTLAQRIATVGPLNPHRAARLLCDIGDALGFAHARGVVHRDVKPDNILIDAATGRALLSDFGIAHASPATVARLGRRPLPGAPVHHVYEPVGMGDSYFPIDVYDAAALSYGNEQAGTTVWPSMQDALTLDALAGDHRLQIRVRSSVPIPAEGRRIDELRPRLAELYGTTARIIIANAGPSGEIILELPTDHAESRPR